MENTVCLTELYTFSIFSNSSIRPDIGPQFFFLEGCEHRERGFSAQLAKMAQIKIFLASGTFFSSFWKTLQSLSIPLANFFKINIFYSPCQFFKITYFPTIQLLFDKKLRRPIKTITDGASKTLLECQNFSWALPRGLWESVMKFSWPSLHFPDNGRAPNPVKRLFSLMKSHNNS